jgi:uncharacterized RDD family membrane protein YckC
MQNAPTPDPYAPPTAPVGAPPPLDPSLATVNERLAARAIDAGIMLAIFVASRFFLNRLLFHGAAPHAGPGSPKLLDLEWVLAFVAYDVPSHAFGGATIGKALTGLEVRRLDGSACSTSAALVRAVGGLPDFLLCGAVGVLTMSLSRRRQRLGDHLALTVVAKTDARGRRLGASMAVGAVAYAAIVAGSIFVH